MDPTYIDPCEVCGKNAGKNVYVTMTAKVEVVPGMEARGIEPGKGRSKYFVRVQQRQELFRKTGQMHDVERVVDRRNDRYYEHIVDVETGEVVRHKDEPLSEHVAERDLRRREQQEHR
jgi:hypothetical protein